MVLPMGGHGPFRGLDAPQALSKPNAQTCGRLSAERAYVRDMASLMTADELLHVHIPGKQVELVRGVLIVREPPGFQHGAIMLRLGAACCCGSSANNRNDFTAPVSRSAASAS